MYIIIYISASRVPNPPWDGSQIDAPESPICFFSSTYIHACMHASHRIATHRIASQHITSHCIHTQTDRQTDIQTDKHRDRYCIQTIHTHIHTYLPTYMHTNIPTYTTYIQLPIRTKGGNPKNPSPLGGLTDAYI
jgi:hypothetical protein